jgi:hypothetical protein
MEGAHLGHMGSTSARTTDAVQGRRSAAHSLFCKSVSLTVTDVQLGYFLKNLDQQNINNAVRQALLDVTDSSSSVV